MKKKPRLSPLAIALIIILAAICVCPLILFFTPVGQCFDIFGSQVPNSARRFFINRTINAAIQGDDEWLNAAVESEVLEDVYQLAPNLTPNYIITLSDSLGGLHEYHLEFDNGQRIHLTFMGHWHSCPDFIPTEDEMLMNLKISSFYSPE